MTMWTIRNQTKGLIFAVAAAFLLIMLATAFVTVTESEAQEATATKAINVPPDETVIEEGKKVYFRKCVWCHGEKGAGDGPGADRLWPRPRDFTQGTFKIRHSASGELPTDEDLFQTVTHGLPGSAMPQWRNVLSEQERRSVVQFVKYRLVADRDFQDKENEEFNMLDFGKQVPISEESIAKGRELFMTKAKCLECHGTDGRGDGNASQKDEWGFPIFPAQLDKCWNFRGNRNDPYNPKNIFREISTGLNGTPMPSFRDVLSDEDRWHVANFVTSLCPPMKIDPLTQKPLIDFVVRSTYLEGELPTDPSDEKWNRAVTTYVGLAGQIIHKPRNFVRLVDEAWVRSVYNDTQVAYLFEWDDRNKSMGTPESLALASEIKEVPPAGDPIAMRKWPVQNDAFAIEFPAKWQSLSAPEKPRFVYGDAKNNVNLWKWTADGTVQELRGDGFDKVSVLQGKSNVKVTRSEFKDGQWSVIMVRNLTTEDTENDVQFVTGKYIPTVFFAWDGNNGDTGIKSSISTWYYTFLIPPTPKTVYIYPLLVVGLVIGLEAWILRIAARMKKVKK